MSLFGRLWGWGAAGLALLPLIGIALLLMSPPPNPFGLPQASWNELIQSHGLSVLWVRSMALATVVTLGSSLYGLILAMIGHRAQFRAVRLLHWLSLLPLAMPSYILAAVLRQQLNGQGGFAVAALSLIVVCTPYTQLVVGSALVNGSASEEEAARLMGATPWRIFRQIIWPKLRTAMAFSMLIAFLYAISDFGAVAMLNVPVLTWRLYESVQNQDLLQAALLGCFLILSTLPVLLLAHRLRGKARPSSVSQVRQPSRVQLSKPWVAVASPLQLLPVFVGVLLPLIELSQWVFNATDPMTNPLGALWDSLLLSLIGTLLTLVLAWGAAWLTGTGNSTDQKWLPQAVYLSSALPGVLLAFGLLMVTLRLTKGIEGGYAMVLGSGVLLFLGYAMRFLAEAYGPILSGIQQMNPRLREGAILLGASPSRWFSQVAFPILKPSILSAAIIIMLAILKELPVTLILGSATGRRTLAFRIWDRYNEAIWADAGSHALLLCGLALILTAFSLRRHQHA
ncbi:MAG: ABC transporter permease [Myxococcota bacterium]